MTDYKFLRACITDEQLSDEIRRVKNKMDLTDEQLVQLSLIEFVEEHNDEKSQYGLGW